MKAIFLTKERKTGIPMMAVGTFWKCKIFNSILLGLMYHHCENQMILIKFQQSQHNSWQRFNI